MLKVYIFLLFVLIQYSNGADTAFNGNKKLCVITPENNLYQKSTYIDCTKEKQQNELTVFQNGFQINNFPSYSIKKRLYAHSIRWDICAQNRYAVVAHTYNGKRNDIRQPMHNLYIFSLFHEKRLFNPFSPLYTLLDQIGKVTALAIDVDTKQIVVCSQEHNSVKGNLTFYKIVQSVVHRNNTLIPLINTQLPEVYTKISFTVPLRAMALGKSGSTHFLKFQEKKCEISLDNFITQLSD